MLDIIRQQAALADVCTHLQVACGHVQNPFARFYLRDMATDIRVMGKRLEPVRAYAWQQIKEINKGREG